MKKKNLFVYGIVLFIIVGVFLTFEVIIPRKDYNNAVSLFNDKNYKEALSKFEKMGDYKDSISYIHESLYNLSKISTDEKKYDEAMKYLSKLGDYKNSKELTKVNIFNKATDYLEEEKYEEAYNEYEKILDYNKTQEKLKTLGLGLIKINSLNNAKKVFEVIKDEDSNNNYIKYIDGRLEYDKNNYKDSIEIFKSLKNVLDSENYYYDSINSLAKKQFENKEYENVIKTVKAVIKENKESKKYYNMSNTMLGEKYYKDGYLNTAKTYFNKVSKNFTYDGINVDKRKASLKKYAKFLPYCGEFTSTKKNKYEVRSIWYYDRSWESWYNKEKGGTLTMKCYITPKGIKLDGSGEYTTYTNYSTIASALDIDYDYANINKTVKKLPKSMKVGGHVKVTFKKKKIILSYKYTDKYDNQYFDYRYTSKWTYNKRTKKY